MIRHTTVLLMITTAFSQAASIIVQNYSFESPFALGQPGPAQGDFVLNISNWTSSVGTTNQYGFVQVATSAGFIAAANGVQYAGNYEIARNAGPAANFAGNTIYFYQDLNVAFLPNSMYTVTLAIGNRTDPGSADDGLATFGLFSSNALGSDVGTGTTVNGDTQVTLDQFADFTYTFTTGAIAPTGNVTAYWQATADGGNGIRANVDNYRVDVISAVPEPSHAGLMGFIGLGLMAYRRR